MEFTIDWLTRMECWPFPQDDDWNGILLAIARAVKFGAGADSHKSDYDDAVIRVVLPFHLRTLARVAGEVEVEVDGSPVTLRSILDALEAKYPMLRGTIRDHVTFQRRPFVRYFSCGKDLSLESPETRLPEAVANGKEPFLVVGAIAGG